MKLRSTESEWNATRAHHVQSSSLIDQMSCSPTMLEPWKVLLFLSFQNLQCSRIATVSKSCLYSFWMQRLADSHKSSVEMKVVVGMGKSIPAQFLKRRHTCWVKVQSTNKCLQDSADAWQRLHWSSCGHPLCCKLSAVRHCWCTTSHIKNLHLDGALDFQISLKSRGEMTILKFWCAILRGSIHEYFCFR